MLTSTSLKNVPRFSIFVETSAVNLFVFLTFVLQFILGSSYQREENLPVYFHFHHRFQNSRILSSVCIGPFRSDVSGNCGFYHHYTLHEMDCFNCYPHDCYRKSNFMDITANLVAQKNGPTEENQNLKRFLNTSGTLFVDLERQCNWLKRTPLLEWYVNWCEDFRWPNNGNSQCRADTTTPTTTTVPTPITSTTTTSSTKLPIISFTNFSHSTFPSITNWTPTSPQYRQKINSATSFVQQKPNTPAVMVTKTSMRNRFLWTTTSSTIPINSSNFSPSTTSLPITHQQNNSTTDIGVHSSYKSSFDNKILWISLGVIAIFCTLTVFVILFCQRAKIAKFLRRSENPDVLDDAFYYTDVSMGRRENPSDGVTYENVIPNLLHNEPSIDYIELDFNVQKNSNPSENAAAEINSTTLNQKRDIKGYVDSVIYAELRK